MMAAALGDRFGLDVLCHFHELVVFLGEDAAGEPLLVGSDEPKVKEFFLSSPAGVVVC